MALVLLAMELEGHHPDPWSLSPHQLVFRTTALRERERAEMVRLAVAGSVAQADPKERKKWLEEQGG